MAPSIDKWQISGYFRRAYDYVEGGGEPVPLGGLEVVTVAHDPRGMEWHVTLNEDRSALASVEVRGRIDQASLRSVSLSYLLSVAVSHAKRLDQVYDEGGWRLEDALEEAKENRPRPQGDAPTIEEVARVWNETPSTVFIKEGQTKSRREYLAEDLWYVSPTTVDRWTRKAREAGLIKRSAAGRKPKSNGAT